MPSASASSWVLGLVAQVPHYGHDADFVCVTLASQGRAVLALALVGGEDDPDLEACRHAVERVHEGRDLHAIDLVAPVQKGVVVEGEEAQFLDLRELPFQLGHEGRRLALPPQEGGKAEVALHEDLVGERVGIDPVGVADPRVPILQHLFGIFGEDAGRRAGDRGSTKK